MGIRHTMKPQELFAQDNFISLLSKSLIFDYHHSEDIAQETWMVLLRKQYEPDRLMGPWISGVIRNLGRMLYRNEQQRKRREQMVAVPDKTPPTMEIVERHETRQRVVEAVFDLNESHRSVILLRFYDGLSHKDIAERLNIPLETMRTRLKRGIQELRKKLDANYNGDRKKWCLALAPFAGLKQHPTSARAKNGLSNVFYETIKIFRKGDKVLYPVLFLGIVSLLFFFLYEIFKSPGEDNRFSSAAIGAKSDRFPEKGSIDTSSQSVYVSERTLVETDLQLVGLSGNVVARTSQQSIGQAHVVVTPLPFTGRTENPECLTNSKGHFSVAVPLETKQKPTGFHLHIAAEGFKDLQTFLPYAENRSIQDCGSFDLDRNKEYTIQIVDQSNAPLPGARFRLHDSLRSIAHLFEKTADSQGYLHFSDQEMDQKWESNFRFIHVTHAGMADLFYCGIDKQNPPPSKLVMEPKGLWFGSAEDGSTGKSIHGASVGITSSIRAFMLLVDSMDQLHTQTDATGSFALPRITIRGQNRFKIIAYAKGYGLFTYRDEEISKPIQLKQSSKVLKCYAIDASSGQPLSNTQIRIRGGFFVITDGAGVFYLPSADYISKNYALFAPDKKKVFRVGGLDRDAMKKGEYILPFEPVILERVKILVQDELQNPVVNAKVMVNVKGIQTFQRSTGEDGIAVLPIRLTSPSEAEVRIKHSSFCRFISEPFCLGSDEKNPYELDATKDEAFMRFSVQRGILIQNLRVLDQRKNPQVNQVLFSELTLMDGKSIKEQHNTSEDGWCDMTFPPFQKCLIYVEDREDTAINLSYEQVCSRKEITFVLPEESGSIFTIEGLLQDSSGKPIKEALIIVSAMEVDNKAYPFRPKEDGSFSFPVSRDRFYRLSIDPLFLNNSWYTADDLNYLTAGAHRVITMNACEGVGVDLYSLRKKYRYNLMRRYSAWLESEDLIRFETSQTIMGDLTVLFLGIPEGRMRVVIEFEDGQMFDTPLFEYKQGKSFKLSILKNIK